MSFVELIRPELRQLKPYSSARREANSGEVWLNANENPYCMQKYTQEKLNRYPEPQPASLRKLLSQFYAVDSQQILITPGSDAGIDLLIRLFCRAGQDAIMTCPPVFMMFENLAAIQGASVIKVPLLEKQGFALDVDGIINNMLPTVKILFLCSPNNPTGNMIDQDSILTLCKRFKDQLMIVVDEAYIEFSDSGSMTRFINDNDNLIVLRTLSKAFGLAGARCGTIIANPKVIQYLQAIMLPYPHSILSINAAEYVLQPLQINQIKQQINLIKQSRDNLFNNLASQNDMIEMAWPSQANFILLKVKNANLFYQLCCDHGVIVRQFIGNDLLTDCVRISVGRLEENQRLLTSLENRCAVT